MPLAVVSPIRSPVMVIRQAEQSTGVGVDKILVKTQRLSEGSLTDEQRATVAEWRQDYEFMHARRLRL